MLIQRPKSKFFSYLYKGGKIVIAAELGCFVLSYLGWRKLNTDQDLRYYMYKNHNWLLESYYTFGEKISSECQVRNYDMLKWQSEGKV